MFIWTEEMVRFMHDAAEFGGYYPAFAQAVAQALGPRQSLCDSGCGLGHLAAELTAFYPQVTAADVSPQAVAHARRLAAERKLTNLRCVEEDLLQPGEVAYDAMTFCFFGSIRQILQVGKSRCSGTLAAVMKDDPSHRFSLTNQPLRGSTATRAAEELTALGIPYRRQDLSLEMGQPFRNLAEAVRFFQIYSRDQDPTCITEESMKKRLVPTQNDEFPLYLPGRRQMGILLIETKDIPQEVLSR